jgi:hypothetical protein
MSTNSEQANGDKPNLNQKNDLSRQMTLQLDADQYERLFFQPSQAKGDLARRFGAFLPPPSNFSSAINLFRRKSYPSGDPWFQHPFLCHRLLPPPIPR